MHHLTESQHSSSTLQHLSFITYPDVDVLLFVSSPDVTCWIFIGWPNKRKVCFQNGVEKVLNIFCYIQHKK